MEGTRHKASLRRAPQAQEGSPCSPVIACRRWDFSATSPWLVTQKPPSKAAEKSVHGNILHRCSRVRDNLLCQGRYGETQGLSELGMKGSSHPLLPSPARSLPPSPHLPPPLPGPLPAPLHVSVGHQGGSEDSSGALEPSKGARKSDTLVQGGPAYKYNSRIFGHADTQTREPQEAPGPSFLSLKPGL